MSSLTRRKQSSGRKTSSKYSDTSPKVVFSMRPLTLRANSGSLSLSRLTVMMGVLIFLLALMISLILGTPSVMFMEATPAKWNVLSVIWVPGSPILCAHKAPTAVPGSIPAFMYFSLQMSTNSTN